MYLDEVKEDDKRISDAWKENSNGILVFVSPNLLIPMFVSITSSETGLFSATVGAFVIEFYKKLSPDSGDQTVALLGQISQQLANFSNGTSPSIPANQPFSPSASMIWVNAMWIISLVLSLTSALIATLLQQWARRYVENPHRPSGPNHRARVRSFLFLGTEIYKMRFAVQIAPTLLHLSVYLFFAGLVIVFHTINKQVAIAVEVSVGLFGLAYLALSILPCLDVRCPYRTPMTDVLWYPLHIFLSFAALCLRWIVGQLHGCMVQPTLDDNMTARQRMLVSWSNSCEAAVKTHWLYITDGVGKSIINRAKSAQGGDRKIVTRLFGLLAPSDKSKLQKFAACVPRNRILELIPLIESEKIVLREFLLTLLQSCISGTPHVAGPDEDVRKRSLVVCLDAIHYIAKAGAPDLNFVRPNFANIELMQTLWDDSDTAIRFTSRSICALIAKQVLEEERLGDSQLRWLHEVTKEAIGAIFEASRDRRSRMNIKSFVYKVLSNYVGDLPAEEAKSFKKTLAVLLDVRNDAHLETNFDTINADFDVKFDGIFDTNFDRTDSQNRLSEEVGRIHQEDPQGSREVVGKLRSMFLFLPAYPLQPHAPP